MCKGQPLTIELSRKVGAEVPQPVHPVQSSGRLNPSQCFVGGWLAILRSAVDLTISELHRELDTETGPIQSIGIQPSEESVGMRCAARYRPPPCFSTVARASFA